MLEKGNFKNIQYKTSIIRQEFYVKLKEKYTKLLFITSIN